MTKLQTSCRSFFVAGGLCAASVLVLGSQLPAIPSAFADQPTHQSNVQRVAASKSLSLLERDPKLQQKVTLPRANDVTMTSLLKALRRETGVTLKADARLLSFKLALSVKEEKASSVMDATAALFNATWERTPRGDYFLRSPFMYRQDWASETVAERAREEAALDFADGVENLPLNLKQRLTATDDKHQWAMHFSDLPPRMQNAVRQIIRAEAERQTLRRTLPGETSGQDGRPSRLPAVRPDNVTESRIHFEVGTDPVPTDYQKELGLTDYRIGIGNDSGGLSFTYSNARRLDAQHQKYLASPNTYKPADGAAPRAEAAHDAQFAQTVSVRARDADASRAIMALAKQAQDVSFVTLPPDDFYGVRDIAMSRQPLADALNEITRQYPKLAWERRASGIVVVRLRMESDPR